MQRKCRPDVLACTGEQVRPCAMPTLRAEASGLARTGGPRRCRALVSRLPAAALPYALTLTVFPAARRRAVGAVRGAGARGAAGVPVHLAQDPGARGQEDGGRRRRRRRRRRRAPRARRGPVRAPQQAAGAFMVLRS